LGKANSERKSEDKKTQDDLFHNYARHVLKIDDSFSQLVSFKGKNYPIIRTRQESTLVTAVVLFDKNQ
jgi:hypothetical protein